MFTIDMPYIPPQQDTIVLAQEETENRQPDYLVKGCGPVNSDAKWGGGPVDPLGMLLHVIRDSITIESPFFGKRLSTIEEGVTLLGQVTQFEHGELLPWQDGSSSAYFFKPEPGYEGSDYGTFMAKFDGKYYKIVLEVRMSPDYDDVHYPGSLCPTRPTELIKVNKPSSGENTLNFDWSTVSVNFADLPGSALGETK